MKKKGKKCFISLREQKKGKERVALNIKNKKEKEEVKCQRRNVPIEEIIKALELKKGFVSMAAKALHISHQGLLKRVQSSKELQEILAAINEKHLDRSEEMLLQLIDRGNIGAIKFHLMCKGKNRGYVERHEVSGYDGKPIKITVVYDEDGNGTGVGIGVEGSPSAPA